jgi:hypothetical protein
VPEALHAAVQVGLEGRLRTPEAAAALDRVQPVKRGDQRTGPVA